MSPSFKKTVLPFAEHKQSSHAMSSNDIMSHLLCVTCNHKMRKGNEYRYIHLIIRKKIVYFGKDDTNNEACLCLFFCTPHSALYDLPVKFTYKYISMCKNTYIYVIVNIFREMRFLYSVHTYFVD